MQVYPELRDLLAAGQKLLLHEEQLSDRIAGLVAGYLVWAGLVPEGPRAITITEQILQRQMGAQGRELVALAAELEA